MIIFLDYLSIENDEQSLTNDLLWFLFAAYMTSMFRYLSEYTEYTSYEEFNSVMIMPA